MKSKSSSAPPKPDLNWPEKLQRQLQGVTRSRSEAFLLGLMAGTFRAPGPVPANLADLEAAGTGFQLLAICQALTAGGPIAAKVLENLSGMDSADKILLRCLAELLKEKADTEERKAGFAMVMHDPDLHERYLSRVLSLRRCADQLTV